MAAVTSASNAPAPTPAQLSQLPENTSSLSHYVEDTAASPDESSYFRPVEDVLDFDGQNRYQQDIAAKASISLPRSAIGRCQSRRQLRLDAVADHHQPPCQKYGHKLKQFLPDCVAGTLTPSFLTGQSATAKTTTARPLPSKQRSAKTPPKSHAPAGSVGQR